MYFLISYFHIFYYADKNDLLKTLTIIEYKASRLKSVPSTNHVTVSEVYSSTNSDYAEGTKEQQNGKKKMKNTPPTPKYNTNTILKVGPQSGT